MIIRREIHLLVIYSLLLYGLIWPDSIPSNIEAITPSKNKHKRPEFSASIVYKNWETVPFAAAVHKPVKRNDLGISIKSKGNNVEWKSNEDIPQVLKDILINYYKGAEVVQQERAFKRVMSWKEDFENIAGKYRNVNWKMLSAIIKAETQGKSGRQESSAKAVGISQIKYQGAWAFLWDVLFRQEIKRGSGYMKDYYNANLRVRYRSQLQQISQYLEKNKILVKPTSRSEKAYRNARSVSWNNLKEHLRKKYKPGEYQVAVDIAAMYIDHLIITFQRVKHQVIEIREYVEGNHLDSFSKINFSGTTSIRWNSIKSKLLNQKGEPDFREKTLTCLNHILNSLEDPSLYSAAYNFGISKCLEYMESGMELPKGILRYVKKISRYHAIFNEIEIYKLYI